MMTIAFMGILLGLAAIIPLLRNNKFYLINAALVMGVTYYVESNVVRIPVQHLLSHKALLLFAILHLICINFTTFVAYGVDKRAAVRHQWRVPEADLHTLEFLGGWIGAFIGQKVFHHKTAKKSFQRIYILMIILEILAIWGIYNYLNLGKFNFF